MTKADPLQLPRYAKQSEVRVGSGIRLVALLVALSAASVAFEVWGWPHLHRAGGVKRASHALRRRSCQTSGRKVAFGVGMKTPQEKKRFSYAKDRRNTYGENSKASRKGIPLAKARANRSERHAQDRLLSATRTAETEDDMTAVEVQVKGTEPRKWRKEPDKPLGEYLVLKAWRKARRAA